MGQSLLLGWENFYVITGSSAGGLIGLTFVVIALIADGKGVTPEGLHAFVTPTIVHFSAVLLLAAYLSMPHATVLTVSAGVAVLGLLGIGYTVTIRANMRRSQPKYAAVREDWIWNVVIPLLVHLSLLGMGLLLWYEPARALHGIAAASLMLLFTGIHNAWDIAVWMTVFRKRD